MPELPDTQTVAAVDLGSNSFHMLVARLVGGEVHVVDRLKERVALAEGLDEGRKLSREARDRAVACLSLFGERLKHMRPGSVRAVGTNTLRAARNARGLIEQGSEALGHPIEVISGREEARLIYLGVAHTLEGSPGRRLVVDIGGGSTECIIGEGLEPRLLHSLYMGHISWTGRFFADGLITRERMNEARLAAGLELEPIKKTYRAAGWKWAVGSSGTALAIESLLRESGWGHSITAKGLRKLRKAVVAAGHVDQLALPGLAETRRRVLPGGVAILSALFDDLLIEEMRTSQGALREGLVYDHVGRMQHDDSRDRTVRQLMERFHVDAEQAARVEATALVLLDQVALDWGLEPTGSRQALRWAAALHEIGQALTYTGYHRHGAYIIQSSDMPGFSKEGQEVLATLVLQHRRKLRPARFEELSGGWSDAALRLCILLRLSCRLNRARAEGAVPPLRLEARKRKLGLTFPRGWLPENPLARADLEREAARLEAAGWALQLWDGADADPGAPPVAL